MWTLADPLYLVEGNDRLTGCCRLTCLAYQLHVRLGGHPQHILERRLSGLHLLDVPVKSQQIFAHCGRQRAEASLVLGMPPTGIVEG